MERDPVADERGIFFSTVFLALLAIAGLCLIIKMDLEELTGPSIALFVGLATSIIVVAVLHCVTFLRPLRMILARALLALQSLSLLVAIVWSVVAIVAIFA